MVKYNIYMICKNEEIYLEKKRQLDKYKSKICHIQWVPAEYLTLTQCNRGMLKKLKTIHNTKDKSIIAKLGCIAAHRKALLAIFSNQTNNNLILEEDATLSGDLPAPPKESCYMGGWIVPPQVSKTGKVKINVKPHKGMNMIDYDKFKVITTHALFVQTHEEALILMVSTILPEKLKNYDIHLAECEMFDAFYYPPVFVQGKHKSEIGGNVNKNDQHTHNYGL
jgi:hypothetical protein